jgi:hypothetical protein
MLNNNIYNNFNKKKKNKKDNHQHNKFLKIKKMLKLSILMGLKKYYSLDNILMNLSLYLTIFPIIKKNKLKNQKVKLYYNIKYNL